ncbi:MAG: gliding motility-associated C-terminal domain-containing protein [Bacteroidales bacterium]|nr:gliding motility-associated C-terminal domain-containing protein [Bacteroidales bacterium]MBN2817478.1 gliding motility-associated C-terminal domain-containing protein [Bacteroidales bacterium]
MKRYILIILLFTPFILLSAQLSVGGVENEYYKVVAVGGANTITCDASEDLSSLQAGDKVMLIQMVGATISQTGAWQTTNITSSDVNYNGAGRFELMAVSAVDNGTKVVSFTSNIKRTYNASQKIQLVKIVEAETITVDSELNASDWDGEKGGIIALVAFKKLILNANIDASSNGFQGASVVSSSGVCRPQYTPDTFYFDNSTVNKAALKGEGIFSTTFTYLKGNGNAYNGGGGGLGLHPGGGGGGNLNAGGLGGYQKFDGCASQFGQYTRGGLGLDNKFFTRDYEIDPVEQWPALSFGGGGGGSTESSGFTASEGGNGGGIVFILTDTLVGNGYSIRSDGGSVSTSASAGAGGGGAGGTVVIDGIVDGNLTVSVKGGDGGSTDANCGGAGGGGAGGVIWYSVSSKPATVTDSLMGGQHGSSLCGDVIASNGNIGDDIFNYVALLNGFTFNAVTGDDTICFGQAPNKIIGSTPKGVSSPVYKWLTSTDNSTWTVVNDSVNKDMQPPELTVSRYYTRVVTNDDGYSDTAFSCYIHVFPLITNNGIDIRDTICTNVAPGLFNANVIGGGNSGDYKYYWQAQDDGTSIWTDKSNDEFMNETGQLTVTTYYRRVVESGKVCFDTSEVDTMTVLPLITGNDAVISPDTTICQGLNSGTIKTNSPGGGDGFYFIEWYQSTNNIVYNLVTGANAENYSPGVMSVPNTFYYKRVVYSGNDNACIDTSTAHLLTVLPELANFNISSDSTKYCSGDDAQIINGSLPTGGGGSYNYTWYQNNGSAWVEITGEIDQNYNPPALTDTTIYRRDIISGADDACKASSNELKIKVIPPIINVLETRNDTVCEGEIPIAFTEQEATGGAGSGSYSYLWERSIDTGQTWIDALQDISFNNLVSYQSPGVPQGYNYFRRITYSDICNSASNEILVEALRALTNNTIFGAQNQYACYNSPLLIDADSPLGGASGGTYNFFWLTSDDGTTWSSAPGSSNAEDYTTQLVIDTMYYSRLVLSGNNNECRDTSEFVLIRPNLLPEGDIVSSIDTLCEGEEINISISDISGNGPWIIKLGEPGDTLHERVVYSPGDVIRFAMDASANIQILKLIDDSLCAAVLPNERGLVAATVYEIPVANAGEDFDACNLSTPLNAQFSVDNSYGWWTFDNGSFDDNENPTATVTVDSYTSHNLVWTEATWTECFTEDDVFVTFFEQPVEINAGNDTSIAYTQNSFQLEADIPDVGSGYWSFVSDLRGTFVDSTLSNTLADDMLNVGEYILLWTIENGPCEAITDELLIEKKKRTIYGGFSPNNGDNLNNEFVVGLSQGATGRLYILDLNGNIIKRIDGESQLLWDGTNEKGVDVPAGVYLYILNETLNGVQSEPEQGTIDLRR